MFNVQCLNPFQESVSTIYHVPEDSLENNV